MDEFLKMLDPLDHGWNSLILILALFVIVASLIAYHFTKSRSILTAMPGLFTSLGLLGTFCAICFSLGGISSEKEYFAFSSANDAAAWKQTHPDDYLYLKQVSPNGTQYIKEGDTYTLNGEEYTFTFDLNDESHRYFRVKQSSRDGVYIESSKPKAVGEVASTVTNLDIKKIISDLIPAFSTSIYGLILAFFATFLTKIYFGYLDSKLEKKLRYKEPELALEALDDHILQLTKTNEENNNKLNDSIIAQSQILSEFVKNFMGEMEDTFKAMNATIEQRVSSFGTTQYEQSRQLLEGLTKKLGEDAIDILADHNKSVKTFTDASSAELTAMKEAVTTAVAAFKSDAITGIERLSKEQTAALEKLSEDSLSLHMESLKEQQKFNEDLLGRMSSSLSDTTTRIVNDMAAQISILKGSIETSVLQLKEAYEFITDRSANIVSNYEQATEAYRDAVQNTHDINEKVEAGLSEVESSLKAVGQTNDKVGKVIDLIEAKEANMEAIAMRIEALSSAIASLERLESVLSRISAK